MGVHTQGSLSATLSRELTEEEFGAWEERIQAGRTGPVPCAHPNHEGAPLEEPSGGGWLRCRNFGKPDPSHGHCWSDSERFDPDGWTFDDSISGDIGIARLGRWGFEVEAGGKVYDLFDGVAFFVETLPDDVMVEGDGMFDSDGMDWAIAIRGREVREVAASVVVEGDPAPVGTVVWVLGHVNFADGTIALKHYSSETDARVAFGEESAEHAEHGTFSHRDDAPWVAHFVTDGECITWLDREVIA